MNRRRHGSVGRVAAALVALASAAGCAGPDDGRIAAAAPAASSADVVVDAQGRPQTRAGVVARMRSARFVLLGEVHDNAAQHRLRAALLRELLAQAATDGRATWVVFEQIDRQHAAAVAAAPREVEAIVTAGRLDRRGWAWPLHRPLFEAALAGGAVITGGNLSRAELSPVVRQGEAGLPADLRRWFDGSMRRAEWGPAQAERMLRLVDEGHCKALPAAMMAPMALAQRARDAALAQSMLQAPAGTRVVLIAGNGHVRRDVGVPRYLDAAGIAAGDVLVVGFEERDTITAAATADPNYDLTWRTAPAARADPCESFHRPAPPGAA